MSLLSNLKKSRPWEWLLLAVATFLLLYGFGCLHGCGVLKSTAWSAGGGAAGAAVGSLAGPGGTIVGAGIGAGAGHLMGEDQALRSGDLQGEGAAEKEIKRLRGVADNRSQRVSELSDTLDSFRALATRAALWAIGIFLGWFGIRNRAHWTNLGIWNTIKHGLLGGSFGQPPPTPPSLSSQA